MAEHTHEHARDQRVNGEWNTGFWTCTPIGDCCLSSWCPCILYGRTAHRMRDPTLAGYEKVNEDCKKMGHLQFWTGCGWMSVKKQRTEIRERYNIPGSTKNDGWAAYCCLPCAQIQLDQEVEARARSDVNKEGYRPQDGMEMPNSHAQPQQQQHQEPLQEPQQKQVMAAEGQQGGNYGYAAPMQQEK